MTKIVTEFVKFRYNRLPTGMCASGDIFQAKLDETISDTESVKTYIRDILVLSKDSLSKHIEQLSFIFGRFQYAGLKIDTPDFSFG